MCIRDRGVFGQFRVIAHIDSLRKTVSGALGGKREQPLRFDDVMFEYLLEQKNEKADLTSSLETIRSFSKSHEESIQNRAG